MIALANVLLGIGQILNMFIYFFIIVLFVRMIVSWVNADPYNPMVRFLTSATEPLLAPIRRVIPSFGGGIDLSPLVLLAIFYFLEYALVQSLMDYAMVLRREALGAL